MATKTKAPTGLTISRNGNSFKCSWKCADKNYNDGQGFRYLLTGMKARASLSIGKGDRSKALTINPNNYYPKTTKYLTKVTFDVRGNCAKYKKNKKNIDPTVSSWASKTLVLTAPARPTVTEKLDDTLSDTTAFTWEVAVSDTNVAWFTDVQWESMLVKDSNETNGAKLSWSSSALGYQTGTGGATGTKTITESTGITALASFTRWFRIRSRGPAGASAWTYIKHIYAKPNSAVITKADAKPLQNGYLTEVYWTLALPNARPIDKTIVQYQVATPADMLTRPEENSWTDANVSKDIRYDAENSNSAALFNVDGLMGLDKCLFVRVNTQHDTEANTTLGDPALAYIGRLTAPRSLSVTLNHTSHKATITATNESAVADSFMVVKYIPASDPDGFIVGVMTASGSITVQCPDWSQETGYRFEVYTAVGTYTETVRADGVSSYEVNALMVSDSVNNGGVVPLPPENVSVSATSIPGTARVVWDWAWAEATSAEIAWADHPDAWESTDAPETYEVGVVNASAWNISGLETGVAWYIRARLLQKVGDTEVASAWSDMQTITLSSAPSIPVLSLSAGVITADGSVTASWVYSTTDGTGQSHATIAELTYEDGEPVYTKLAETETEQHITISAEVAGWQTGESHSLVVQVMSASGRLSDGWSDPVAVIVADPLTAEITATSLINADIEVNPREFSGDIVTFETEMEEAVTSLTATIEPIQEGTTSADVFVSNEYKYRKDAEPYTFRATPQYGCDKEVDKIVGGTVAWNQLVPISGIDSTITVKGVTFTNNGDGTVTINGTASDTISGSDYKAISSHEVVSGHKYLFSGCPKGGSRTTYFVYDGYRLRDLGDGTVATPQLLRCVFYAVSGTTFNNAKFVPQIFDLTAMFGTTIADYIYSLEQANAGAGVAWFKKLFPKPYYEYNAGELISVEGLESHDTVGFNQWDEEWEVGSIEQANGQNIANAKTMRSVNYIPVFPNTDYKFTSSGNLTLRYYDADKNFLGVYDKSNRGDINAANPAYTIRTMPSDCHYLRFATWAEYGNTYKNDICINLSWSGYRNGEYEPYEKHSYPLDNSLTLRGIPKLDSSNNLYYDGDEYESDGTVTRKYDIVDLGTLNWIYDGDEIFRAHETRMKFRGNGICTKYKWVQVASWSRVGDGEMSVTNSEESPILRVHDSKAGTDATAFKTAMSGVYLVYELATPTTETAEPYTNPQTVNDWGTEEYVTTSIVPVGHKTQYYTGEWYRADFGRTIYGGSVDLISGVLTSSYDSSLKPITPQTYQLTPQTIATLEGVNNVWGDSGSVDVRIAEMVERDANVLDKMPLTVTVSGADVGDTTTLIIERATDYQIEQPDEKTLNGYEGEAVFVQSMTGAGTFTIDGADLIGMLNDGATYRIIATVQDGLGQSATADIITFLVRWAHQALIPSGQVSSDTEHMVAIIKPIAPTGTEDGDTCDIYRLSIDRPLLIYEGATFGETYVDPFPTVGENGGHRIVFKSKDGDYITADETMAWTDFGEDEGDFLPNRSTIIDFGTGRVNLDYDIDLSSDWSKDVEVTNYLGGAVQGDWNPAINRTGKVSAKALLTDVETIEGMRRLADYPGICHVRTNEGSSYAADVQVSEGVSVDSGHKVASFDISITKVDPESLDGLTYAEWLATQQEEA